MQDLLPRIFYMIIVTRSGMFLHAGDEILGIDERVWVNYTSSMEKSDEVNNFVMEVFVEKDDNKARFTIHGEIDTRSGVELNEKFQEVIENEGITSIELDLEDVNNITSAGIGKILKLLKYLNSRGGTVTIKGISPGLRHLFREIHLDKIIPIEEK